MKKIISTLILLFAVTASANAAWCRAESFSAWGEGTANTVEEACNIALHQCSIYTPYNQTCYVVSSTW